MRALLEDDFVRTSDAVDELRRNGLGAHVVTAAHDEGRHVDLTEAVAHIPAAHRAGDRPIVRALHRLIVLGTSLGGPTLHLRAWPRAAVQVAVVVDLHR